ncbi:hypothetical protein [Streptomyces sp. NPDC005423]|uniref:hypothetical protein n=1 Tax=Streptomyces sp. NPDC005423 TaxID=3155343 RepID=UPI00339F691A
MAKNKNRDRKHAPAERGQEQAQPSSMTNQAEERISHATPSDMARKGREKRFGHN